VTTADWTVAKLYEDVNHDSAISAGDTLLSTANTLSGGKFAFTGFSKNIASGTFQPNACMVSLTTSSGATLGHTFKLSIAAAADVTVTGGYPVQVYGAGGAGTAIEGNVMTIGIPPFGEIHVMRGANSVTSGSTDSLGTVAIAKQTLAYDIKNLGGADLSLFGSPDKVATSSLVNCSVGVIQPSSPVSAGSSQPFTLEVTPAAAGNFSLAVSIANTDPDENPYTFTVSGTASGSPSPPPALDITTTSLPAGAVGTPYSQTVSSTGGTAPYTWTLGTGAPPGLSLAAGTGSTVTFSGTPTMAGTYTFNITVSDSSSPAQSDTQGYTITIAAAPAALDITTTSLPNGQQSVVYSTTVDCTGGTAPFTWTLGAGAPPGLSLSGTGAGATLSGTPTAAGTYTFNITVSDSASPAQSDTQSFTVVIAAPGTIIITTTSLPAGVLGTPYSANIASSGGTGTHTWQVSAGSLPAGLALSGSGAVATLSGMPTVTGAFSFTVQVTDGSTPALTDDQPLTLTIAAPGGTPGPIKGGGGGGGGCAAGPGAGLLALLLLVPVLLAARRRLRASPRRG
ncbi:MAG: putative Ig domain-containing protein, partial [Planctomycetes bacterium]|nr:putative Ig domain-containing protein [Planctomycetota bacterium]